LPIQGRIGTILIMNKRLSQFIGAVSILEKIGDHDPEITALIYDSRKVVPGTLFFALSGLHTDGASYIHQAIENGARAIIHAAPIGNPDPSIVYIKVKDPRFVMSVLAATFYDHPSRDIAVIGVTGTEGKSTTVSLIFQLLRLLGKKTGFFSTVNYCIDDEVLANPEHQTTPEATTVHEKLAQMRDNRVEYAVLESSSHGLSPLTNRLGDVAFDVGVLTNVTHEHLEFHGTHEQYKNDKANLFRFLDTVEHVKNGRIIPSFGVVNEEDSASVYFRAVTTKPVFGFSTWASTRKGVSASFIKTDALGSDFIISCSGKDYPARINIPGAFNVYNVLAAVITVCRILEKTIEEILPLLPQLEPLIGRMTIVDEGQPYEVLVDYAHTPTSFQTVFPPLRKRITGKIISVFGSGGERDTLKRPEQGRIAADYSDIVILTDEDPRNEDSHAILDMIAAGCLGKTQGEDLLLIPNRPKAIRTALSLAKPGDLVLLLGKGHENSIIYRDHTDPYDEISEVRTALNEAGYGGTR